jgi:hypothetical protein
MPTAPPTPTPWDCPWTLMREVMVLASRCRPRAIPVHASVAVQWSRLGQLLHPWSWIRALARIRGWRSGLASCLVCESDWRWKGWWWSRLQRGQRDKAQSCFCRMGEISLRWGALGAEGSKGIFEMLFEAFYPCSTIDRGGVERWVMRNSKFWCPKCCVFLPGESERDQCLYIARTTTLLAGG